MLLKVLSCFDLECKGCQFGCLLLVLSFGDLTSVCFEYDEMTCLNHQSLSILCNLNMTVCWDCDTVIFLKLSSYRTGYDIWPYRYLLKRLELIMVFFLVTFLKDTMVRTKTQAVWQRWGLLLNWFWHFSGSIHSLTFQRVVPLRAANYKEGMVRCIRETCIFFFQQFGETAFTKVVVICTNLAVEHALLNILLAFTTSEGV